MRSLSTVPQPPGLPATPYRFVPTTALLCALCAILLSLMVTKVMLAPVWTLGCTTGGWVPLSDPWGFTLPIPMAPRSCPHAPPAHFAWHPPEAARFYLPHGKDGAEWGQNFPNQPHNKHGEVPAGVGVTVWRTREGQCPAQSISAGGNLSGVFPKASSVLAAEPGSLCLQLTA